MSVETKPNKLVKGLVLDTFHTDVDNTVATYALNSQLEDQEGNHFHYGSEVGTTFIKNIPDTHVVVGHINMERNETVLFTTDGTNSTIGILSRNDDMSYQYEIKVDDTKQTKKLGFKKNIYIRGVYRLLNGCDKIIYFVDGINKDRRINLNQLDSYKLPTTVTSAILFVVTTAIIRSTSTLTGDIKIIRVLSPTNIFTQSNVVANLIRAVNFQSNLSSNSLLVSNINFVQKAQASLLATGTTTGDLTVEAAASLLLDLYPNAATAYSLRKLRTAYSGSAIRVRRSSDNTEQDIGFTGNDLNTTALTTFVGAGNGFVTTWYDQSGNANNATMTTQANQPQIVSSGSVILTNGKPSVNFDGTNDSLNLSSSFSFANTGSLISFVGKRAASGDRLYSLAGVQYNFALWSDNKYYLQSRSNGYQTSTNTDTSTNQLLLSGVNNGTNQIIYKNNSAVTSSFVALLLPSNINNIGNYANNGSAYTKSNLQEIIFYNSQNSSNLNGINTNINTHYAIY